MSEEARRRQRQWEKQYRLANPESRNAHRRRNYARGALWQANSRKEWTGREDQLITASDRPTDRELARQLHRTVRAIQMRRFRIKVSA